MTEIPALPLADGTTIPQLGFGTFQVPDAEATAAVSAALEAGYRHIDTAAIYGNEVGVGRALADSGLARDEFYVTTKLWNNNHRTADARAAIESSLSKLGLDHVDLYLIHWPAVPSYGDSYIEAWDALQAFKAEGLTTSIGVSNFQVAHLDALRGEVPVVNQIEVHPSFAQVPLRRELDARGIVVESWGPLGQGADLTLPAIIELAEQYGKTPAQVIIRWHLQHGFVVFPKSATRERIAANADVFDFELDAEAMARIDALDTDTRIGADPDTATF